MKAVNQNILLLGIPALLVLAGGIALFVQGDALMRAALDAAPAPLQGEAGDVEGYAYLIGLFGAGLGGLFAFALQLAAVLAVLYGGVLMVLGLAARLVFRPTPGHVLAYRILTGINLTVLVLPAPSLAYSLLESASNGRFSPGLLVCLLLIGLVAALVIRNTYTARLLQLPARRDPAAFP